MGRAEKLLHFWYGPFRVKRQTTPVNYEVEQMFGRQKRDIIHVERLKKYFNAIICSSSSGETGIADEISALETNNDTSVDENETDDGATRVTTSSHNVNLRANENEDGTVGDDELNTTAGQQNSVLRSTLPADGIVPKTRSGRLVKIPDRLMF